MKFREFYNPHHVYDGYFETYFIRPFFHHYADFRSGESVKSCLLSLFAWLLLTLGLAGILMGLVGLLGPEVGFSALLIGGCIWGAASIVPLLAIMVRAFRGAADTTPRTRLLGVDTLFGVSSLLFFVFGFLMMLTTVNSGTLHPNDGYVEEEDTATLQLEEVTEEPIFTYQDEVVVDTTPVVDTMAEMTEPDLVAPEESFDPTIEPEAEELLPEEPVSDSL